MKLNFNKAKKLIRSQLPNYHPDNGQPLHWTIFIGRIDSKFNERSGKAIGGKIDISITQTNPFPMVSSHQYCYDWGTKKIEKTGATWYM